MKTLKIGVMLLALLLAAMVIVPMVSAGETPNGSISPGLGADNVQAANASD